MSKTLLRLVPVRSRGDSGGESGPSLREAVGQPATHTRR